MFPRFHLSILSPVEAVFKSLHSERTEANVSSVLAALLAYMAHSNKTDRNEMELNPNVDNILSNLFRSINPSDLPDWRLGAFLSGE